ncbi:MAG: alcohol dehydrogenase catalytic domain-containing protein [Acidobacteria bacterium]|nr:alcohol dehydrogenase catalytic domain-containing protein [Acidobacteriota bacterium]
MCDHDSNVDLAEYIHCSLSRRDLLKTGAAAVAGAGAALFAQTAAAQTRQGPIALFWGQNAGSAELAAQVEAERQTTSRTAGMKFRALVRYENSLTTETLTLKPVHPLQVVIRTQASQTCYSSVGQLNTTTRQANAVVTGHGGVGIVEDVGTAVKRVTVGDQVILATTPNCGVCGQCLNGRGDICMMRLPALVSATMADNTPVFMTGPPMGPAGYSEILVADEDWVVPVFTRVPPVELSILACVGGTGLGLTMCRFPIEAGTDVAIFGLGPIGISAVQGARIQGAKTIIGIDPIRYRRELALELGATHMLDPNALTGDALINRIRELTPDAVPTGRRYLGERPAGPMYVLEAAGGTRYALAPGVEAPADSSGIEALQQAYAAVRNGGYVRTCSIGHGQGAMVSFPAGQWSNGARTHVPGNYAGVQAMRDLPKFVRLIERGQFDARSMVGRVLRPDQMREAVEVAGERSAITSVIDFT